MKGLQILIGFFTTFVIITGGSAGVIMGAGHELNHKAIIPCCILGLVAAAKEVRSMLQLPPLSNGNYTAIAQLMKDSNARKGDSDPQAFTKEGR